MTEAELAVQILRFLEQQGWCHDKIHGTMYQTGFPDYWISHPTFGGRWLELKRPGGKLTASQKAKFSKWAKFGTKVFVMTSIRDYKVLFGEANWMYYV